MADTITVDLEERSYPIVFNSLEHLGTTLANGPTKVGKCVVVSNTVVGPLYKDKVMQSLRSAGWEPHYVEIQDGEDHKNTDTYVKLVNDLLDLQVDRKTPVVAVGGGVTTDIVGFAAATVLRGVPFANVPTTLLAQVDASVGGKTGVNTKHGKNLLGAFWQPTLVYMAVETLSTLTEPEFRCGLGEVVKHAVLEEKLAGNDCWVPCCDFFEWLEANHEKVVKRDQEALKYIIRRCCEIKAAVVSQDERESGKRALLNLGHTVGHAIEAVVGYGGLRHGEAVALGTVAEAHLAVLRGYCTDKDLPGRITRLLKLLSLPTEISGLNIQALVDASLHDKKREDTHISVTMVHAIGDVRLVKITPEELIPAFECLGGSAAPSISSTSQPPVPPPTKKSQAEPVISSNAFATGSNQNAGNFITDRRTTRVHQPPGGKSSITFG